MLSRPAIVVVALSAFVAACSLITENRFLPPEEGSGGADPGAGVTSGGASTSTSDGAGGATSTSTGMGGMAAAGGGGADPGPECPIDAGGAAASCGTHHGQPVGCGNSCPNTQCLAGTCASAGVGACVIDCPMGPAEQCDGVRIECNQDHICFVTCSGTDSCKGKTIVCPVGYDCRVRCTGVNSCEDADIICPKSVNARCVIRCANADACKGTRQWCGGGPCRTCRSSSFGGTDPEQQCCDTSCACTQEGELTPTANDMCGLPSPNKC